MPKEYALESQVPQYLNHLIQCADRMLYWRDVSAYFAENQADRGDGHDAAHSSYLQGNIACLVLTSGARSYGVEWVGASFKAQKYLKDLRTAKEPYTIVQAEGAKIAFEHVDSQNPAAVPQRHVVEPLYRASDDLIRRDSDSEYLLLNLLAHFMKIGEIPRTGRLSLLTERIPCKSCTSVIARFAAEHPEITIDVYYMYDTKDIEPSDFFDGVGDLDIGLYRVAYHVQIQTVKTSRNSRVNIASRAREQIRMFGGSPNQIISSIAPASASTSSSAGGTDQMNPSADSAT